MAEPQSENLLIRWWHRRQEKKKKKRPQPETFGLLIKENLEAFVFAVVLVVIVRHFSLTPFRIPSSSMEPTLLGNEHHNDRLFVNRWVYTFNSIRRWDVVVFLYPLNQEKHFIKRLVGLPGEKIAIADGDIYVNGKIARKSEEAQRSLWLRVNHVRSQPEFLAWQPDPKRVRFDESRQLVELDGSGERPTWFRFGRSPEIRDNGSYRQIPGYILSHVYYRTKNGPPQERGDRSNGRYVGDLRLRCQLTAVQGCKEVTLRIVSGDQQYTVVLPVGSGKARFTHDRGPDMGKKEQALDGFALTQDKAHELAYWHLDRQLVLELDGKRWTYEDPPIALADVRYRTDRAEAGIAASKGKLQLVGVKLDRDIYYTNTGILNRADHEEPPVFEIPPEHYFVLGDNSASSSDSRLWAIARITLKDGRVINRELNPGGDREWSARRLDDGRHVLYRDEYGQVQRVDESQIVSIEALGPPNVEPHVGSGDPDIDRIRPARTCDPKYQTVHRELIIGRAFFIFWPLWRVRFIK